MRIETYRRREVIAAALTGWLSRPAPADAAAPRRKPSVRRIPIGLQLWSVRDDCKKDIDATLKQVAQSGFEAVEFAGLYKYQDNAKALRETLDAMGMRAAGNHLSIRALRGERFAQTVKFHQMLGCHLLIVGGDPRFTDPEASKVYAAEMNTASEALKKEGLYCGHHNHKEEFTAVGDTTYWDLFAQRTSQDVFLQLDIGWAFMAGLDPATLIKRYPGRFKTLHLRGKVPPGVANKLPIIGKDTLDWPGILSACRDVGGAEYFMVEQEEIPAGMTALSSSTASLRGLRAILAGMKTYPI
jgi:sugar phosphate isomerase/epimerase